MKRNASLLLTLPFVVLSLVYIRLRLSENGCWGLIEFVYTLIIRSLLVVSLIIAIVAVFRKSNLRIVKAKPVSLIVLIITFLTVVTFGIFEDTLKGSIWIKAERENDDKAHSHQMLEFREKGTCTVYMKGVDFTCYNTGPFTVIGDTIVLGKQILDKADPVLAGRYLVEGDFLIPLSIPGAKEVSLRKFRISK